MNINLSTVDLAQSFKKMQALQAAEIRKKWVILELVQKYQRQGQPEYMATRMAETEYNSIHKNLIK